MATGNFETALKAEMKRVVRIFHAYDHNQVATLNAAGGSRSQKALDRGEFFYTHPDVPGKAFRRRSDAARFAMTGSV